MSPRASVTSRAAQVSLLVAAVLVLAGLKWLLVRDAINSPLVAFYGLLVTSFLATRVWFGHRYRSTPSTSTYLPSVAVIVPVKNEGLLIGTTIARLFSSGYPADRLDVVVIDDGSNDETGQVLRIAAAVYPRLSVVTLPTNVGKRRAMAVGVERTTSDIVVVIDSDTFIEPGSIARLMQPFANERVAAAAGYTEILNEEVNFLTRVQALIYDVSFLIHKSAEATYGSVTCCPGCFSAYRRTAILPLMPEWTNQRFLGEHTIFGDDRSLTMMLLREGFEVTYEPTARARTDAPETLKGYLRQQLRWKKSWIQQGLRGCTFMWRRPPLSAFWFYTGFLLSLLAPHVILRTLVIAPLINHVVPWRFALGLAAVGTALAAYLSIRRGDTSRLRALFAYPFVGLLLVLQYPLAIAKLSDAKWGTR